MSLPLSAIERQTITVLLIACLCMVWLHYPANRYVMQGWLWQAWPMAGQWFQQNITQHPSTRLYGSAYWAVASVVSYAALPLAHIGWQRYKGRANWADYGLAWPDAARLKRDAKLFVLFYAVMLPLVWWASAQPGFLAIYPFFKLSPGESFWPHWLWWEALYFSQFIALEFFFRGYVLHGLRPQLGVSAIFVMVIPYCMIHFEKPMLESLAAILAGITLGYLSYRYRSIVLGIALHCSVALTMDLMALYRKGLLL